MPLLIIFILVPLIELAVLIKVGGVIGIGWTIAAIVLTAIIGVQLLKAQGLSTLTRAGERLQAGDIPMQELAEGFLLALAGAMLLTPGFLTDLLGFFLLVPGMRGQLARTVMGFLQPGSMTTYSRARTRSAYQSRSSSNPSNNSGGNVVEGEYHRED